MRQDELDELRHAKSLLESPGLATKITNLLGSPLTFGLGLLPPSWSEPLQHATRASLSKALDVAVKTLGNKPARRPANFAHKLLVAANGAASGVLGLPALIIELPVSTTIMLRSIADVARSEGEDISDIEARLACMEVFALGDTSAKDNAAEAGYFVARAGLARAVSDAAKYIAEKGLAEEGAPALVRLIGSIAAKFGVVVSEKVAVQAIPIIGAAGGALINTAFINHFQDTARGHFIIRRLERAYGTDEVRRLYRES